jgi:Reverse transcriptase (RNA-dependent DNA polymerase)
MDAKTKEKVYIVGGPKFGSPEGHTLLVNKALYGLRSSGHRWHERHTNVLRSIGFATCKTKAYIWIQENDGLYEYIAVYVDDLC